MAMQVGEEGNVKSEPNVVPMIDIMLVLLIIFMIVTPVISKGFVAEMPLGKNITPAQDEQGDVVLGIDNQGRYFLDPGTGTIGLVPADQLESVLKNIYQNRDNSILYFRADKGLDFGTVQNAVEIVRKAGVRVMAAIAEERRDQNAGVFTATGGGR